MLRFRMFKIKKYIYYSNDNIITGQLKFPNLFLIISAIHSNVKKKKSVQYRIVKARSMCNTINGYLI